MGPEPSKENQLYDRVDMANNLILGVVVGFLILGAVMLIVSYIRDYKLNDLAQSRWVADCYNMNGIPIEGRSITNWNYMYCINNNTLLWPKSSQHGGE